MNFKVIALSFLLASGCRTISPSDDNSTASTTIDAPIVKVLVSVDWEGRDLQPHNLTAMQDFRRDFPNIALVQYLNAAYYTKPNADAKAITAAIRSTLRERDQLGLHIHGWKSLFERSGVTYRNAPSLRQGGLGYSAEECKFDCGHVIALIGYKQDELSKVIACSRETLNRHGFGKAVHFRAGAWMTNQVVAEALTANGIATDSSAVPAEFLADQWGNTPLYSTVKDLWPGITPISQPYSIKTAHGPLTEIPDNGCLSDYMTGEAMEKVLRANIDLANKRGKSQTLMIGFHQETAANYLPNLRNFLKRVAETPELAEKVQFTLINQ